MHVHGVGGQADQALGFMADAWGLKGADFPAVDFDPQGIALGADDEGVPLTQAEFGRKALLLSGKHLFLFFRQLVGFFTLIESTCQVKASRLGICKIHAGGADGGLADVTGVGAFVVLVIKPDIEALCFLTGEAELDADLQVFLALKLDIVHGAVVRGWVRDTNEDAVFDDAGTLVVAPSWPEGFCGEIV